MNKNPLVRWLIWVAVVCLIALGVWDFYPRTEVGRQVSAPLTDKERAEMAAKRLGMPPPSVATPLPVPLSRSLRLAIGGLGFANDEQNGRVADLTLAALGSAPGFVLVERQSLDAILGEMQLTLSGLVRAKDAVRVGKLMRVDWFLLGTMATINGTKSIVVRVVDARTGITEDATVIAAADVPPPELARRLAKFVVQSRRAAAEAKPRVYLAVGAFEDLSLNTRAASFPAQLQGYLTAAYKGSQVTMLEREQVDILLQEMRLDLAGLTDQTNKQSVFQSAFWLVDGNYQSYETTNFQIEVKLSVQRIFGTTKQADLRGMPGDPICSQIKRTIDVVMKQYAVLAIPTRQSEIRAQLSMGKELSGLGQYPGVYVHFWNSWDLPAQEADRQKRNMLAAIRAFQTVLLLDPENRAAKTFLACCFEHPTIRRKDEARNLFREILEDPKQDEWTSVAKQGLAQSWWPQENAAKLHWFETAEKQSTNAAAAKFYSEQVELATDAEKKDGNLSPKGRERTEATLFKALSDYNDVMHHKSDSFTGGLGIAEFVQSYGTNRAAALKRLDELYPRMTNQAPDIVPHILAALVRFQTDTNAKVVTEFQRQLVGISKNPMEMLEPSDFWNRFQWDYGWAVEHHLYEMAAQFMQGRIGAAPVLEKMWQWDKNEDRVCLAYADLAMERWREALQILEGLSNQPVLMGEAGLWSTNRMTMVLPRKVAAKIRQEHGLPVVSDPREFEMGKAFFCFPYPGGTFAADETGVWIAINGRLYQLGFDLKTNLEAELPISSGTRIAAVCLTPKTVWIGTSGEGLVEWDRATRKCTRLKQEDGLMMNAISSLYANGETLWIGYGDRTFQYNAMGVGHGGGLGNMDLETRRFSSFTLSLTNGVEIHRHPAGNWVPERSKEPTRRPVLAIASGETDDIWFVAEEARTLLRRFQPLRNVWSEPDDAMWNCTTLVQDGGQLLVGIYSGQSTKPGPLGVNILNMKDGKSRGVKEVSEIPAGVVTAMSIDGGDLWVGGRGYIAVMDLDKEVIRKYAFIKAQAVDALQIAGGHLWAQYGGYMHQVQLTTR